MSRKIALLIAFAILAPAPRLVAQILASAAKNPEITFSTPGEKQVTLEACNAAGCTMITRTVVVLDPTPVVTFAGVSVAVVEVGQLVRLSGSGKGQPPLSYVWEVLLGATPILELSGATTFWNTTGLAPGVYTLRLRLANPAGFTLSAPALVTVVPSTPADFYTVTPCRVVDTRLSNPLANGAAPRLIDVAGSPCGIPPQARAVAANVTIVGPTGAGHLTLYPGNYPTPQVSTINFSADQVRANHAVLPLATDGSGALAAEAFVATGGSVHLIVDVSGYFL